MTEPAIPIMSQRTPQKMPQSDLTPPLPAMSERPFVRLPSKALWQMRISSLIPLVILCVLLAVLLFVVFAPIFDLTLMQNVGIIASVFIVFAAMNVWLTRLQYNYTGYRLDADGLAIRKGVLWRSETIALRSRVQHIDITRTPLARTLGLAKINVYTAGTKLGKISLEGLALADAESIRDQLISRSADTL